MMLNSLQILRAFAAWAVVAQHYVEFFVPLELRSLKIAAVASSGRVGVYIFFVISGLVMAKTILSGHYTAVQFMANRIVRIVPAYWFFTFLAVVAAALIGYSTGTISLFESGKPSFAGLGQSLTFLPFGEFPLLAVGWTLNFEMFFYALLAVCMIVWNRMVLVLAVVLTVALPFVWPSNWLYSSIAGSHLLLLFACGAVLGVSGRKFHVPVAALMLLASFLVEEIGPLHVLAPAVVILFLSLEGRFKGEGVFMYLGQISYSTYLCHTVLFSLVAHFAGSVHGLGSQLLLILAMSVLVFAVSAMSYELVERKTAGLKFKSN